MMAEALLRLGHADVARDYLDWYAPLPVRRRQGAVLRRRARRRSGARERQPRRIYLPRRRDRIATRSDRALLDAHVAARARRGALPGQPAPVASATAAQPARPTPRFYGLLPPSISHEGYSAKPMHSYWDDFWALQGLRDAAAHRRRARQAQTAAALWRRSATNSRATSLASLAPATPRTASTTSRARPSSAISTPPRPPSRSSPGGDAGAPARAAAARRPSSATGASSSSAATAAGRGTTTRLTSCARSARSCGSAGATARTTLLDFFLADRRPAGLEPMGRGGRPRRRASRASSATCRTPGSRPTSSAPSLDLFAYERDDDRRAGARRGHSAAWLDGDGVRRRRTCARRYGRLSYSHARDRRTRYCCTSTAACACRPAASCSPGHGGERRRPRASTASRRVARRRTAHHELPADRRHRSSRDATRSRPMTETIEFPDNFLWGAATSAYQIEGSPLADGAGPSIWQRFCHTPASCATATPATSRAITTAATRDDVALMRELGLQAYRFSISWSRVLPRGHAARSTQRASTSTSGWSTRCSRNGIEPMVDAVSLGPARRARRPRRLAQSATSPTGSPTTRASCSAGSTIASSSGRR